MTEPPESRHRIGAVVRLTGVSAHALRAWERRYAALSPERTPAGDRLYSDLDVRRLRMIKRLTEYGHAIGSIARLDEPDLEQLLAQHMHAPEPRSGSVAADSVERYLDALGALDLDSAERVLKRAAFSLQPREFIRHFAEPLLATVGARWQVGSLCVANEHAASAMLRTHLGGLLAQLPVEPHAPCAVSATPAGERHEFGALFAAITAALAGYRAIYLGPDLPAVEIARAARITGARAILVSIVVLPVRKARVELEALRAALSPKVALIVGGTGAVAAVRGIQHIDQAEDLHALTSLLVALG